MALALLQFVIGYQSIDALQMFWPRRLEHSRLRKGRLILMILRSPLS
jgi:hypothetical protein